MAKPQKYYGKRWWTQEWLTLLAHLDEARLERGCEYAAAGRVMNLQVRGATVTGQVRGSRIKPYSAELRFAAWTPAQLRPLYPRLRRWPGWKQTLKAAELPIAWRADFAAVDLRLLPSPDTQMHFACSCPDWSWPCKHALALCAALSERMDEEPLLMLELQGFEREVLFQERPAQAEVVEPLALDGFWQGSPEALSEALAGLAALPRPEDPASPLGSLGAIAGATPRPRLLQALEPVYARAAETAGALLAPRPEA